MINVCPAEGYSTSAMLAAAQEEALLDERREDSAQMHDPYLRTHFAHDYLLKMRYLTQTPRGSWE